MSIDNNPWIATARHMREQGKSWDAIRSYLHVGYRQLRLALDPDYQKRPRRYINRVPQPPPPTDLPPPKEHFVNALAREYASGGMTFDEFHLSLDKLYADKPWIRRQSYE